MNQLKEAVKDSITHLPPATADIISDTYVVALTKVEQHSQEIYTLLEQWEHKHKLYKTQMATE